MLHLDVVIDGATGDIKSRLTNTVASAAVHGLLPLRSGGVIAAGSGGYAYQVATA